MAAKKKPNTVSITVDGVTVKYTTKKTTLTRDEVYELASIIEKLRTSKTSDNEQL